MKISLITILLMLLVGGSPPLDSTKFTCEEIFNIEKDQIKYEHDKALILSGDYGYNRILECERLTNFLKCAISLANEGDKSADESVRRLYREMADSMLHDELNFNTSLVYGIVYETLERLENTYEMIEISLWFMEANICPYDVYIATGVKDFTGIHFIYSNYSFQIFQRIIFSNLKGPKVQEYGDLVREHHAKKYEEKQKADSCNKEITPILFQRIKADFEAGRLQFRNIDKKG